MHMCFRHYQLHKEMFPIPLTLTRETIPAAIYNSSQLISSCRYFASKILIVLCFVGFVAFPSFILLVIYLVPAVHLMFLCIG